MQSFAYLASTSIGETVALLAREGERARVLSGGTDLLVQLREGRRQASLVIDVKSIPELNELSYRPATGLRIGAAVPCQRIYSDPAIRAAYPGLIDAASLIGGVQIQGRASLGGNVCNASPAADSVPALTVHYAMCEVAGPNGLRDIPAEHFCTGPGRNALQPGEFLVAFRVPSPPPRFGAAYLRFIPRNEMDIAVVGAGASVELNAAGNAIVSARVALGAVAPTPLLVAEAGAILAGQTVSSETIERAAHAAQNAARPITDMRGTAAQRRHLSYVLARRAIEQAIARAQESIEHG